MKPYFLTFLLVQIISTVSSLDDRVIWPKFDDSSIPSGSSFHGYKNEIKTNKEEESLTKLLNSIFGELDDSNEELSIENRNDFKNSRIADNAFSDNLETFSNNLYKIATKGKSKSVLISALSANLALGMIAYGAKGNTRREILQTLHLPENNELLKSNYEHLHHNLMSVTGSKLKILNKLFISTFLKVKQTFRDVIVRNFHAEVDEMKFSHSRHTARKINKWVSRGTNYKIQNIVNSHDLTANTEMFVANVVYFKGEWKYKFTELSNDYFHTDFYHNKLVTMMYQNVKIDYGHVPEINAKFVELPYKGDELKMIIVLPDYANGLEQIERNLETMKLKTLRMKRSEKTVDLHLPKFRVESTINLNDVLVQMGMKQVFTDQADLSGIAEKDLKVDQIKQKIIIEVNEDGAEAAAATAISIESRSDFEDDDKPIVFNVNYPFHYKIIKTVGENDGIVIFAGNYKNAN